MSDYNSRAVAQIEVNGNAAQQLTQLKQRADDFRDAIAKAYKEGNDKLAKKLTRDLKATEKEIRTIQSQAVNVEQTLRRMDKATPKELRRTLKQLKTELDNIERGSKAWDEHQRKIRAVKEELAKINAESQAMVKQGNLWDRFAKKMFDWSAAIQTVIAAVTGITLTARKAVNAFAEMDQEMANVRKFTGMTAEEVEALNDEFKKMDTRSSREQLNQLAQEAGRLGMQSQEDVMGFVRAADKINVALDELGDGATLSLSKLTDIFGDRERLGVEKSLLAVGSVINELSQNCTASAPYIAEFASRLAGVGAQAGMTTQQIMGYAAVMDSYGQKVESSATALSQVIVRLYRDPAKYAKVAGLDVQQFADLLKRDANAALIQLLETLNKAGGMDVLSPMFKDMGENGARAIQALATMAKHIDKVKSQQEVANQAFEEAVSIDKEFNVQNNTVQAGLEKAKKNFNEMAVALGEKLAPLMKYTITSSSALMKVMAATVDFIVKNKTEIIVLAASVATYYIQLNAATIATKVFAAAQMIVNVAAKGTIVVWKSLCVALNLLTFQENKARKAWVALSSAMNANPYSLAVKAIIAATAATALFIKRLGDNAKAATEAARKQREYLQSLRDVETASNSFSKSEISNLRALYSAAMNEKLARDKRIEAVKQMQSLYPNVFANFSTEEIMAGKAKNAYDELTDSIIKNARARAAAEKILENEKAILDLEEENNRLKNDNQKRRGEAEQANTRRQAQAAHDDARRPINQDVMVVDNSIHELDKTIHENVNAIKGNNKAINENNRKIKDRKDANEWLQEQYKVTGAENKPDAGGSPTVTYTPGSNNTGGSNKTKTEDKFKAEKEWREREDALNRIAYATGEKNYTEYTDRMLDIERGFYEKQLAHADLSENERLTITAQFHEATRKMAQSYADTAIGDEERDNARRKAELQQLYIDGLLDTEAYNTRLEQLEMEHLARVADIRRAYAEAHPEDEQAEEAYNKADAAHREALAKDRQRRREEYARKVKEHAQKLDEVWENYFKTDKEKREEYFKTTRALIEEAYRREIEQAGLTAGQKLEIERRYRAALDKLNEEEQKERTLPAVLNKKKHEDHTLGERAKKAVLKPLEELGQDLFSDDDLANVDRTIDHVASSVAAMYSSLSEMWQNEEQLKLAQLEKRYDAEISMAEGNAYKIKEIEKKKAREQAAIKANAQKRQFAQQVLSALAQTAQAAINAYSSAAAIPLIGHTLAPIAAGMAVAAGMMQVAVIKQQQSLSAAQGYAEGGFTPDGPRDKPVGIVHAGEWVASQKLVNNPVTRPAIDALEFAQRNNRFGSLRQADVSRAITAPTVIAQAAADGSMQRAVAALSASMGDYSDTMRRLGKRLDEPFVTVNTVSGDTGIKQAQDEYQRLMNNTLPKSKRK